MPDIVLYSNVTPAIPDCLAVETIPLGDQTARVTQEGKLVTARYGEEVEYGDYCVGVTQDREVVAVMCDPCTPQVITIAK